MAALLSAAEVRAHGAAGERRFIEPFVTEDAATQNEAVAQGHYVRRDGRDFWLLTYEIEKTLSENTSVFIEHGAAFNVPGGGEYDEGSGGGKPADGFLNMEAGIKHGIFKSDKHEAIVSLAAAIEVPTGTDRIGAEEHPALEFGALFAKGFGDLPEGLSLLRPFALMGDLRWETPLGDGRPVNALGYNLALTFDLRTLHEIVNFPAFLEPLSLVTEFNFETMVNGDGQGETDLS